MVKIKVVLLVLVAEVVCGNLLSETEREAAETTENLKRLLNDGNLRLGDLYTSLFFPMEAAAVKSGTYAQNTEFCEGLGGGPLTLTSQRKIDLLIKVFTENWNVYRYLGVKRLSENGKWQWATGEDIEPSNFKWSRNDPAYQCMEVYMQNAESPLSPYGCESGSQFACEVEGQRYPHVQTPAYNVVKNIKTRFIVVNDPSKNYAEAKAACESEGIGSGRLATPSSNRELEVIDRLLRQISEEMGGPGAGRQDAGYWLGAKRNFRDAPAWNTGFKIVGNLRQFVGDDGGRCLLYIADAATAGSVGKFDWVNCGDSEFSGYICQIDKDLLDG